MREVIKGREYGYVPVSEPMKTNPNVLSMNGSSMLSLNTPPDTYEIPAKALAREDCTSKRMVPPPPAVKPTKPPV